MNKGKLWAACQTGESLTIPRSELILRQRVAPVSALTWRRSTLGCALGLGIAASVTVALSACGDDRPTIADPSAQDDARPEIVLSDASAASDAPPAAKHEDIGTDIACGSATCIASLAAGRAHACAKTKDGAVYCWGTDELGQLGRGRRAAGGKDAPLVDCSGGADAVVGPFRDAGVTPAFAAAPAPVDVRAERLAVGGDTTCVKTIAKTVECWGADQATRLPDVGLVRSSNAVPRRVGCLPEVADLAVGTAVTCAVLLDGSLRCWGALIDERLASFGFSPGCADDYCAPMPFTVDDPLTFASLVQRGGAFLGLTTSGDLRSWGIANPSYKGGLEYKLSLTGRLTNFRLRDVVGLAKVTSMSVGLEHACVVSDGRVMCWGMNGSGVIGRNSSAGNRVYETPVEALLPADARATSVAVNDRNSCARVADGRVFCWGDNTFGQLGSAGAESAEPVVVNDLPALAVDVAVMVDSACALLKDGRVACWGSHAAGQLGDPTLAVGPGRHAVPILVRF